MSAKVKTPSVDDMYIAAQWLDVYEGAEDAEACQRVAAWLKQQGDAKELRDACRGARVSVSWARKNLEGQA